MKTIINSLFVLIPILAFTQNKVRLEQHYLNRKIINPSNTLDVSHGHQHTVVALSSDLNTNGFIHAFHSGAGRKSLYSATIISEQNRKELGLNYIRRIKKEVFKNYKNNGIRLFYPSIGLNLIYDNEKFKLNQTFGFTTEKQFPGRKINPSPRRQFIGEFSANNVWSNNRLIYVGSQLMFFNNNNRGFKSKVNFLKQQSLKLISNIFYTNMFSAEIGPQLILGGEELIFSYLITNNKSHIFTYFFKIRRFHLGFKYLVRKNAMNELSLSIRLQNSILLMFPKNPPNHHR